MSDAPHKLRKAAEAGATVGIVGIALFMNILMGVVPLAIAIFLAMWLLRKCS